MVSRRVGGWVRERAGELPGGVLKQYWGSPRGCGGRWMLSGKGRVCVCIRGCVHWGERRWEVLSKGVLIQYWVGLAQKPKRTSDGE